MTDSPPSLFNFFDLEAIHHLYHIKMYCYAGSRSVSLLRTSGWWQPAIVLPITCNNTVTPLFTAAIVLYKYSLLASYLAKAFSLVVRVHVFLWAIKSYFHFQSSVMYIYVSLRASICPSGSRWTCSASQLHCRSGSWESSRLKQRCCWLRHALASHHRNQICSAQR